MSRLFTMRAVLAAACLLGFTMGGGASAQVAITIDVNSLTSNGCFGHASCALNGAGVTTTGGVLAKKTSSGATGFGVSGGPSGSEIDIGERLRVDFNESRSIIAIKILFLYNGPEFGDKSEKARVIADGTAYTLSTRNDADDAAADWSGPGIVTKCGPTTAAGTGCFIVTDPFPGVVSRLDFTAVAGSQPYPPAGGPARTSRTTRSNSSTLARRPSSTLRIARVRQAVRWRPSAATWLPRSTPCESENSGGSTETTVIPIRLPDCRYIPHVCIDLLPPAGDYAANDNAARAKLISLGVIKTLDPSGPNRLNPAAQLLNVKPLLPPEVTSLFDTSGTPPNGLPSLYVASRWRGQAINDHWFDGIFFRIDSGIVFSNVFEGLIDVSVLTGHELGCVASPGNLLAWDVITTVSELARSVGGRFVDTMINVGCINPTKVAGTRLSLYSVNFEIVPDTFGPTIKSSKPKVTVNNDAVFARLVAIAMERTGRGEGPLRMQAR